LSYLAATEELAGDYATAAVALREADDVAAWYDWPTSPFLVQPRCELLVASGDLEGALSLAERLPDDEAQPLTARFVGEYRIPIYRGHRSVYGIDLFASAGFFALASRRDFTAPARGFTGFSKVPIDLTFNLGLRVSTNVGGFLLGLSNAIGALPIYSEAR